MDFAVYYMNYPRICVGVILMVMCCFLSVVDRARIGVLLEKFNIVYKIMQSDTEEQRDLDDARVQFDDLIRQSPGMKFHLGADAEIVQNSAWKERRTNPLLLELNVLSRGKLPPIY